MLSKLLFLGICIALFAILVEYSDRSTFYPTHKKGVLLLTGASSGIGYDAAVHLSSRYGGRYHVFAGVRKDKDLQALEDLSIDTLHPVQLDVTNEEHVQAVLERITDFCAEKDLPFVGLVNNAGVGFSFPLEVSPMDHIEHVLNVNLLAPIRLIKTFLPLLRQHQGRIINVSSVISFAHTTFCGAYCASKAGLDAVTDSIRQELVHTGVSVSSVQPGAVQSSIWEKNSGKSFGVEDKYDKESMELYPQLGNQKGQRSSIVDKADHPSTSTSPAIADALFNPNPKPFYVVANVGGFPAWVMKLLVSILPVRALDWLVRVF